jgi:hypothetical protein
VKLSGPAFGDVAVYVTDAPAMVTAPSVPCVTDAIARVPVPVSLVRTFTVAVPPVTTVAASAEATAAFRVVVRVMTTRAVFDVPLSGMEASRLQTPPLAA